MPFYDRTSPELIGTPYLMGCDEYSNKVYFMGLRNQRQNIKTSIDELLAIANVPNDEYLLQDTFPLISFSTKIGGLLSKRYYLTAFGRRIGIWGMRRRYPDFVKLVQATKDRVTAAQKVR